MTRVEHLARGRVLQLQLSIVESLDSLQVLAYVLILLAYEGTAQLHVKIDVVHCLVIHNFSLL